MGCKFEDFCGHCDNSGVPGGRYPCDKSCSVPSVGCAPTNYINSRSGVHKKCRSCKYNDATLASSTMCGTCKDFSNWAELEEPQNISSATPKPRTGDMLRSLANALNAASELMTKGVEHHGGEWEGGRLSMDYDECNTKCLNSMARHWMSEATGELIDAGEEGTGAYHDVALMVNAMIRVERRIRENTRGRRRRNTASKLYKVNVHTDCAETQDAEHAICSKCTYPFAFKLYTSIGVYTRCPMCGTDTRA